MFEISFVGTGEGRIFSHNCKIYHIPSDGRERVKCGGVHSVNLSMDLSKSSLIAGTLVVSEVANGWIKDFKLRFPDVVVDIIPLHRPQG